MVGPCGSLPIHVGSQQSGDHVQQNMKLSYPTPHKTKTLTHRTTKFRVKRDEWWERMPIPKDPTVFFLGHTLHSQVEDAETYIKFESTEPDDGCWRDLLHRFGKTILEPLKTLQRIINP